MPKHSFRSSAPHAYLIVAILTIATACWGQQTGSQEPQKPAAETQLSTPEPVQSLSAQAAPSPPMNVSPDVEEGIESGGYRIRTSFEFGGHVADRSGNLALWDTYVNLNSGPRILEESFDMHSIAHNGLIFDDLSVNSFGGYGGDPDNVTRVTADKGGWYDFTSSFRRDQNFWDYNLLANPLNPPTSVPFVPILDSPHLLELVRRNTDLDLRLLPTHKIRFHLGYSHDIDEGNSLTTDHAGTEGSLLQPERDTTDNYRAGASLEVAPRTVLNYDQFFTRFKGDTTWGLNTTDFLLPNGTQTNLGISWNTLANQPCAVPFLITGAANPKCNQFKSYSKIDPYRSLFPTEQFSFQSNYWKRVDFSGRANYSSADAHMPVYQEVFGGYISRSSEVNHLQGGGGSAFRVMGSTDFATTIHITDNLRLVDSFRWSNWRIPQDTTFNTITLFAPNADTPPNVFSPATCPRPFTGKGCPQHTNSSGADLATDVFANFLKQDTKLNTFEVDYDFSRRVGAHVGYRYGRRTIIAAESDTNTSTFFPNKPGRGGCAPIVNGICTRTSASSDYQDLEIDENSALFGFWARPTDAWRINFDTELYGADKTFTRIAPRHMQLYRARTVYKPWSWLNLGGSVNITERRNTESDIENHQHYRDYSFDAVISKSDRWNFDFSYSYDDIFSSTIICFVQTPTPEFATDCGNPFLSAPSFYKNRENFGAVNFMFKPISRVTTFVGYTLTSTAGSTLLLNPAAPFGPLTFNYHLPTASLSVDLNKHLTWKTGWNYYDYNEKSDPGLTLPRDFRGNVFTLSMRYHL